MKTELKLGLKRVAELASEMWLLVLKPELLRVLCPKPSLSTVLQLMVTTSQPLGFAALSCCTEGAPMTGIGALQTALT